MFGTHDLPLFVATALVLNATPGVDMLFTLSRTLQQGWRAGIAAALGIMAGCIVHTFAAALGLAALMATSAFAFSAIKWLGAAYLLWLAWGMLRAAAYDSDVNAVPVLAAPDAASWTRVFAQGFLTNVLNPKVALFFLALLPQFIAADAPNKPLAFLFLGAVFVVGGALFLFALVALAHRLRLIANGFGRTPRRLLNLAGGALFAFLAVRLAQAQR
ncbi:MAG: LysE family translocator [Burkholderiaceae bacterium]|nr:LysE family translocator [Burkholderiaceae bacterium]